MLTPYKSIFSEGKSVGVLYHFTQFDNFSQIVNDEFILKSQTDEYVSFTRNYNLPNDQIFYFRDEDIVRIAVDGDILSNKYKIIPHAKFKTKLEDDREERIKGPVDIKNSIIQIQIEPNVANLIQKTIGYKEYEAVVSKIKQDNIRFYDFMKFLNVK